MSFLDCNVCSAKTVIGCTCEEPKVCLLAIVVLSCIENTSASLDCLTQAAMLSVLHRQHGLMRHGLHAHGISLSMMLPSACARHISLKDAACLW
jgi:hypothetical protein